MPSSITDDTRFINIGMSVGPVSGFTYIGVELSDDTTFGIEIQRGTDWESLLYFRRCQ